MVISALKVSPPEDLNGTSNVAEPDLLPPRTAMFKRQGVVGLRVTEES